jgi:hypothetical protein
MGRLRPVVMRGAGHHRGAVRKVVFQVREKEARLVVVVEFRFNV